MSSPLSFTHIRKKCLLIWQPENRRYVIKERNGSNVWEIISQAYGSSEYEAGVWAKIKFEKIKLNEK